MKTLILTFLLASTAAGQLGISEISQRVENIFSPHQAIQSARFFTQFWRIGGGPGFDTCIGFVATKLGSFGFTRHQALGASRDFRYSIHDEQPQEPVWVPLDAELRIEIPELRVLHSFAATPLMLCRNSFPQDMAGDLIYVKGGGNEEDYEKIDVSNRIVLCDAPPSSAYALAMARGALGIISSHVPEYNHADRFPDLIADGSIPYDDQRRSFGLKVSTRTAGDLKRFLSYTEVHVRVTIQSDFVRAPIKTLEAEISGTSHAIERVVIVSHLDHYKPGANDNASGSAALLEIARSISALVKQGSLPQPARTLTFLWVDEIRGSSFWIKRHESELKNIKAVFVMDMVGGDPEKTGGTFRIERMPDPGVLWPRMPDRGSGWGKGIWDKDKLSGHYLNDYFLSVAEFQSSKTGWKVGLNPYEGGSDHVPFLSRGIPAVLAWHFPDTFYHSSLDDMSNLSASEMKNAGVTVATAALGIAYGSQEIAQHILQRVSSAAKWRLDNEHKNSAINLGDAQVQGEQAFGNVKKKEKEIIEAWGKWYDEAIESTGSVPLNPNNAFIEGVRKERERVSNFCRMVLAALGL